MAISLAGPPFLSWSNDLSQSHTGQQALSSCCKHLVDSSLFCPKPSVASCESQVFPVAPQAGPPFFQAFLCSGEGTRP